MFIRRNAGLCLASILLLAGAPAAHAQWAVVDVGAIAQLIEQIATMKQQVDTARSHLREAQRQMQSMTGDRGMDRLLSGTERNYLPSSWGELEASVRQVDASLRVLTAQQYSGLSAAERSQVDAARGASAMLQTTARRALESASNRFAALQELIDAIPAAQDQKAILDLQARIAAEQGMLANEQTKLDVLYQAAQAEELARKQRAREQAIADVGSLRDLPAMGL